MDHFLREVFVLDASVASFIYYPKLACNVNWQLSVEYQEKDLRQSTCALFTCMSVLESAMSIVSFF